MCLFVCFPYYSVQKGKDSGAHGWIYWRRENVNRKVSTSAQVLPRAALFPRVSVSATRMLSRGRWAPWADGTPISQRLQPLLPRVPRKPFPSFTSSGRLRRLPSKDPSTRRSLKQVIHHGTGETQRPLAQQTRGKVGGAAACRRSQSSRRRGPHPELP